MPIVTLDQVKAQLLFTEDIGDADDVLLGQKIDAVEAYLDGALGYRMADRYGSEGKPPYPADLSEAALQLVAQWYENREASGGSARSMPFGVSAIVEAHRDWTF